MATEPNPINDVINEPWEGHTKGEVEDALKQKLRDISGGDRYNVGMSFQHDIPTLLETINYSVGIKTISTVVHGDSQEEGINEIIEIRIQTKTSADGVYVNRQSLYIRSNQNVYTTVDLSSYLVSGQNYIRFTPVGLNATGRGYEYDIKVVNLGLIFNTSTEIPFTGTVLHLNYLINGDIDKWLLFEFGTGTGSSFSAEYSYKNSDQLMVQNIGPNIYSEVGLTLDFELAGLLTDGVHTVRAILANSRNLDDPSTIQTAIIENQYMVNNTGTEPVMIVLNNIVYDIDNYSDVTFFNWSVYNTSLGTTDVVFKLKHSYTNEILAQWQYTGEPGVVNSLSVDLDLELGTSDVIYAMLSIEDTNGNNITWPIQGITIRNNAMYAPIAGADFVLSPTSRTNTEENPKKIVNAINNQIIPSTWEHFDLISDGYIAVDKNLNNPYEGSVRALHVPAGRKLTINYNPLSEFTNPGLDSYGLVGKSMTLEIDFRVYNVLDENEPIITLGTQHPDGEILGFEMKPTEGCLLTYNKRSRDNQNVFWSEENKTRLSLNIVYALNPDGNSENNTLNYARFFVNNVIDREFSYQTNDRFISGNIPLVLGSDKADIDIFNIRCYKKALSVADVMKDYLSSLSTSEEKRQISLINDILDDSGKISYTKAINKGYNILGHTGHLPTYGDENKGKTSGINLLVHINGDEVHSGELINLDGQGQGNTAMTYYHWNQQYKFVSDKTNSANELVPGTRWIPEGDTEPQTISGYSIESGEAPAKKLVGKINFASSMQGHKMGATKMFNDVFKELVRVNRIEEPTQITLHPDARIAVYSKPFLFFHRETANDPWVFKYLMTFGAAKADKKSLGYYSNTEQMYYVEGTDNDVPLALFSAPWNEDVTYDTSEDQRESWMLYGVKNITFRLGVTEIVNGIEVPVETEPGFMGVYDENEGVYKGGLKPFFNFVYNHNISIIRFYDGTYSQLVNNEVHAQPDSGDTVIAPNVNRIYWLTSEDGRYNMYRYDRNTNSWIGAGVNKEIVNLRTIYENYCDDLGLEPVGWTVGRWDLVTESYRDIYTRHFAAKASDYIHVDDALYHSCFIKFIAGTDNRAKNTYYYTDPNDYKIRFSQDDLDTIIKTNNLGQQRKPYYVEEHDRNSAGEFYWQGENNGLYNLLETAFAPQMEEMMYFILSAMATLSGTNSAFDYIINTLLQAQDYFPAIAYNEFTRLVYENASIAQANGRYTSSTDPLTQSNGSQRWSEYQWLKDRYTYISSWAGFGEFSQGTANVFGAFLLRGTEGDYNFVFTPAKWLYPRISLGSSFFNIPKTRLQAGQTFAFPTVTGQSDALIAIHGINYYSHLGDFNIPLSQSQQAEINISGKRLQNLTINPDGNDINYFKTTGIVIANAVNIKEFIVRNVDTLTSNVDLSNCIKLEKIDMRGSTPSGISLPSNAVLTEVKYPASITNLIIDNKPYLTNVTFEGTSNIDHILCRNTTNTVATSVIDILVDLNNNYNNISYFYFEQGTEDNPLNLTRKRFDALVELFKQKKPTDNVERPQFNLRGYIHPTAAINSYQKYLLDLYCPNLTLVDVSIQSTDYDVIPDSLTMTEGTSNHLTTRMIDINALDFRIISHNIVKDPAITDEEIESRIHIDTVNSCITVDAPEENSSWSDEVTIHVLPKYEDWDNPSYIPHQLQITVNATKVTGATLTAPSIVRPASFFDATLIILPANNTKPIMPVNGNPNNGIFITTSGDFAISNPGLNMRPYSPGSPGTYNLTVNVYVFGMDSLIAAPSQVIQVMDPYIQFAVTTDGVFSDISTANPTITLQQVDDNNDPIGNSIVLTGVVSSNSLVYTYGNGNVTGDGTQKYQVSINNVPGYNISYDEFIIPNSVQTIINLQYVVIQPDVFLVYTDGTRQSHGEFVSAGYQPISGKTPIAVEVYTATAELYIKGSNAVKLLKLKKNLLISAGGYGQDDMAGFYNTERIRYSEEQNNQAAITADTTGDVWMIAYLNTLANTMVIDGVTYTPYIPAAQELYIFFLQLVKINELISIFNNEITGVSGNHNFWSSTKRNATDTQYYVVNKNTTGGFSGSAQSTESTFSSIVFYKNPNQ